MEPQLLFLGQRLIKAAPRVFQRLLVAVPSLSTLSQETLDRLEAAQQALPAVSAQRVYRDPDTRNRLIGILSHELADRMAELSAGRTPSPDRSDLECAALALLDPVVMSLPGGFVAALEAPRQAMGLADNALRRGDIYVGDAASGVAMFPSHLAAPRRVEDIRKIIARRPDELTLFDAITVLVLVLNIHAYPDGNGRTARMLFNHCLRMIGMPADQYVPLSKIFLLVRGGFEIRLRYAEIGSDWNPIANLIADIILELSSKAGSAR